MADLFSELHRRHPDVDLVLLPAPAPLAEVPEAGDDQVADTFSRVAWAARQLWSAVAPDSEVDPSVRWSYAADPGRVRAVARFVETRDDGFGALVALRHELETHGWEVVRPEAGVERLIGFLDEVEVAASYAGTLVLCVSSEPLVVGGSRAAQLVRGGR